MKRKKKELARWMATCVEAKLAETGEPSKEASKVVEKSAKKLAKKIGKLAAKPDRTAQPSNRPITSAVLESATL